jgi:hypothetical protein
MFLLIKTTFVLNRDEMVYDLPKDALPVRSRLTWGGGGGGTGACCGAEDSSACCGTDYDHDEDVYFGRVARFDEN